MKLRPPSLNPPSGAFTLVELLVSITILTTLILFVTQLLSNATTTTGNSRKYMDVDNAARVVFDRMANDFAKMIKRPDVDCLLIKQGTSSGPANDLMFFYGEAPAYSNTSTNKSSVSLLGYRINFKNYYYKDNPVLERLGEALTWDGASSNDAAASGNSEPSTNTKAGGMVFSTFLPNTAVPASASTLAGNWQKTIGTLANKYADGNDRDYHVLSDHVYRLELSFLLKDGKISTKPITSTIPANWPGGPQFFTSTGNDPIPVSDNDLTHQPYFAIGSRWLNTVSGQGFICSSATKGAATWNRIGVQDVSAIIVGLGMLDPTSRKIIAPTVFQTDPCPLVSALPDAVDGVPIARTWGESAYLTNSGIPRPAAAKLRTYQRYLYLNAAGAF